MLKEITQNDMFYAVSWPFGEEGAGLLEFLKFGFLQNSSRLVFSCSKSDPAEKIDIDKFF